MPTTEKLRSKLMAKLTELFQLDQPDLDFGFYRIMQAKASQVKSFIDKDLLQIIENAFGLVDEERKAELKTNIENEIKAAEEYGVPDPETSPKVMEAKARYDAFKEGATAEADVYDHLYRFFERYYDEGDFISRRYYARENAGKAAPFAIPYNGEEVKLHWANADQYYIKTAEYFSNYSFDITKAAEVRKLTTEEKVLNGIPEKSLKVHFRIVDANEGEHGNIKAAEDKKRFFILHEENPVEFNDAGELVINFKYKALPGGKNSVDAETEKALKNSFSKSLNKGDMPNLAMAVKVIEAVSQIDKAKEYQNTLGLYAPTDKIPNRPLLAKYINQYTARNTMDYFIHKDLSGFLKRELDFYIKNEVMHLDDIENADAPAVETYLSKLKVIRKIANKLIEFLAQLEDFQKKLWLKKKFVTETNYCITLDRVPEALYEEIAANDAQREEWVKLFAIDEIKADGEKLPGMEACAYSVPLAIEFLKANDKLVLDTVFFTDEFKARLIESIERFDEHCDGLLIHSENFQALNLLQERYHKKAKCVYIDPPYNTSASEIIYKNSYKHSSWLSFVGNRISCSSRLLSEFGCMCVTIDDFEFSGLIYVLEQQFSEDGIVGVVAIKNNPSGRATPKGFSIAHEYAIFAMKSEVTTIGRLGHSDEQKARYKEKDEIGQYEWVNFRKHGGANANRHARPKLYYPIFASETAIRFPELEWKSEEKQWIPLIKPNDDEKIVYPIDANGNEKTWKWGIETAKDYPDEFRVGIDQQGRRGVYRKARLNEEGTLPRTVWDKANYSSTAYGTNLLANIMGEKERFSFPKSVYAVEDCLRVSNVNNCDSIIDFFAGSGTTGHAVINLNREDSGKRKYILVEMGDYFNTVLKPRMSKVVHSSDWKDGKPTRRDTGISHCFKYIRLESYEDTLNNLTFDENPVRSKTIEGNPSLKEDYMLHYLLDVETRGSRSLLNIDGFCDPTAYTLKVKKPGSDEQITLNIDLIETFNYLIGLRLENMAAPQTFTADFTRRPDPELPEDQHTKLVVDEKIQQSDNGKWWFRKLEGWVPADPINPNNGQKERVLIVWRKLTGNLEEDNLMLDEWFKKYRISPRDFEFDTIYVNGSNNLPNLKRDDENWKVRLIEENFHKKMWEVE